MRVTLAVCLLLVLVASAKHSLADGFYEIQVEVTCNRLTSNAIGGISPHDPMRLAWAGVKSPGSALGPIDAGLLFGEYEHNCYRGNVRDTLWREYIRSGESFHLAVSVLGRDQATVGAIRDAAEQLRTLIALAILNRGNALLPAVRLMHLANDLGARASAAGDLEIGSVAVGFSLLNGTFVAQWSGGRAAVLTDQEASSDSLDATFRLTGAGADYELRVSIWRYLTGPRNWYSNVDSHLCLDVPNGSAQPSVAVQQYPCHQGPNQSILARPVGGTLNVNTGFPRDVTYELLFEHSGYCLDVANGSLQDHGAIVQYPCHRGANQLWEVSRVSEDRDSLEYYFYVIRNVKSGKCLDVPGGSPAVVPLQQFTCHGRPSQQFE